MTSLRVLAIEPYYGGSHRAFLESVQRHSRHRWSIVDGAANHWKWRMRVAPLSLAQAADQVVAESGLPDVVFCSDMLDLPAWLGMLQRIEHDARWSDVPIAMYFHENQWTYPQSPLARVDFHYGYTNLLSALAATKCFFNSGFHRETFLDASEAFVRRMPDSRAVHDFASLRTKSLVIPPGFDPPPQRRSVRELTESVHLGWVSRWEHDKRPDRFLRLLNRLDSMQVDFRLVLLGPRPQVSEPLTAIREQFGSRITVDQFATSKEDYWHHLQQIDLVVSTADHEFFGIAICEAIWAGAAPVLPNRLSYPELIDRNHLYDSVDDAASMIYRFVDEAARQDLSSIARDSIGKYQIHHTVPLLDDAIDQLLSD